MNGTKMNKSESKYFNTAQCMDIALIDLLSKKDFEYITIKEICEKAGVNRSTFYLHYETMKDLLLETQQYIENSFINCFNITKEEMVNKISSAPLEELNLISKDFLTPYLNFIKENKNIFKASFNNPSSMQVNQGYSYIVNCILKPINKRFKIPEDEIDYWCSYYMAGMAAIIKDWVIGGCKESVEKIQTIIIHCVRPKIEIYEENK